jgi:hypothetical protein
LSSLELDGSPGEFVLDYLEAGAKMTLSLPLERGGVLSLAVSGAMTGADFERLVQMLERCRGVLVAAA